MSTPHKIKWNNNDEANLKKAVNNFNAKIRRLEKQKPELKEILPDKLSIKTERQKLQQQPRQTLKREVKSLQRFSRPGSENLVENSLGLKTTQWKKNEITIQMRVINSAKTRERKIAANLEATSGGEPIGLKRGEMGSIRMNDLKPKKFKFEKIHPGAEWEHFVQSVEKQAAPLYNTEKATNMKINYMSVLHNQLGAYANPIIATVNKMSNKDFMEKMMAEQEASFEFIRDKTDAKIKLDRLSKIWGVKVENLEDFNVDISEIQFRKTP